MQLGIVWRASDRFRTNRGIPESVAGIGIRKIVQQPRCTRNQYSCFALEKTLPPCDPPGALCLS
jgi:hypothetical protein